MRVTKEVTGIVNAMIATVGEFATVDVIENNASVRCARICTKLMDGTNVPLLIEQHGYTATHDKGFKQSDKHHAIRAVSEKFGMLGFKIGYADFIPAVLIANTFLASIDKSSIWVNIKTSANYVDVITILAVSSDGRFNTKLILDGGRLSFRTYKQLRESSSSKVRI